MPSINDCDQNGAKAQNKPLNEAEGWADKVNTATANDKRKQPWKEAFERFDNDTDTNEDLVDVRSVAATTLSA